MLRCACAGQTTCEASVNATGRHDDAAIAHQNLNSGNRRMNGLISPSSCKSPWLVGSPGAPSSASVSAMSAARAGSNLGVMKARKRLRR